MTFFETVWSAISVFFKALRAQKLGKVSIVIFLFFQMLTLISLFFPMPFESPHVMLSPSFSSGHMLGTDMLGRDVFKCIVHGTKWSVIFAMGNVLLFSFLGGVLGGLAYLAGGFVDLAVQRVTEIFSSFPAILLVLVIQTLTQTREVWFTIFLLALARLPEMARLVRADFLRISHAHYVHVAYSLGANRLWVFWKHILPNACIHSITQLPFMMGGVAVYEASCDFLNSFRFSDAASDVSDPSSLMEHLMDMGQLSWGSLMSQMRIHPEAYWLFVFPSLLLVAMVWTQSVFADALLDALRPERGDKPSVSVAP